MRLLSPIVWRAGYFLVLLFVKRSRTFISLNPKDFTLKKEIVLGDCGVGVPASIQNLLNVTGMTILNNLMSGYGTEAVAAIGIVQKIYMVPMLVVLGGTQGIMPQVGCSYSSRNYRRMEDNDPVRAEIADSVSDCRSGIGMVLCPWADPFLYRKSGDCPVWAIFLRAFSLAIVFLTIDFLGIAYGAFVAELVLAGISTVILTHKSKKSFILF